MPDKSDTPETERDIDRVASVFLTATTVGGLLTLAIWLSLDFILTDLDLHMPSPLAGLVIGAPLGALSACSKIIRKAVDYFYYILSELIYFG